MADVNGKKATPILTDDAKRRVALAFHEQEILRKVTRGPVDCCGIVIGRPGPRPSAAEGDGPAPQEGQKIASNSAATRAPKARETGASDGSYASGDPAGKPKKVEASRSGSSGRKQTAGQKEKPPEIPESRKTKPNKRENEFMLNLMILRNTLHKNAPACRERAKLAGKTVWRDIRLMTTLVDRIQDALLRTMPASRDEYYSAYAMHGHYELHIDGPVRTARHLLITDKRLAAMAEAAMKSECILCMREGSQIGQCPLREALLETAVPTAVDEGDSLWRKCEYRDAAGQLVLGEDVSV